MYNRSTTAATSALRRKRIPKELPLGKTYMRTNTLPQSPLKENVFLRPTLTPQALSPFFPVSPVLFSPNARGQKIRNLTACLLANGPPEVVFPSFGQIGEQAQQVSSFLDLYRMRARDDAELLKVKSPTSLEGDGEWAPLDELSDVIEHKGSRRRSRSLSDLKPTLAPRETSIIVKETAPEPKRERDGMIADPKQVILAADAKRMMDFRRRFGIRPRELMLPPVPPPNAPLPSPPPPSALLSVKSPLPFTLTAHTVVNAMVRNQGPLKSPKAPYWVKPKTVGPPKTPRTLRSERRQGWGGAWTMGSIGQVVGQLKDMH